jgi:outer membrane murein-binding lipoprotein Lpp
MSNTDEKILKALEDLQAGQQALQTDVNSLKTDVASIKDVQQKQGKHLEALEAGQKALQADVKGLNSKVDTVEIKVEAINAYQKQAHTEIIGHLIESNEINDQGQAELKKRIERIEKHLGLPPLK